MDSVPAFPCRCKRCGLKYAMIDGQLRPISVSYHKIVDEYLCYDCFPKSIWEHFGSSNTQNTGTESAGERSTERYKERSLESKVLRERTTLSYSSRLKEESKCLSTDVSTTRTRRVPCRYLDEPSLDAIKAILSIPHMFRERFRCIIPKTTPHNAELAVDPQGLEVYHCESCNPTRPLRLAEVYGSIQYGELKPMSVVECSRWFERTLHDAGLRQPVPVDIPLPDNLPDYVYTYAAGLRLFIGLRDRQWDEEPLVLGRPFWTAYVGLSDRKVRHSLDTLRDAGVLKAVVRPPKGSREPIQWVLPRAVIHAVAPWRFPL